jgi:hypothetical protein
VKLQIRDIQDTKQEKAAIICGHGPSLGPIKERIEELQSQGSLDRFSLNNWYDYFSTTPTYWIISNTNFNIFNMYHQMNEFAVPIFYSIDGDPTEQSFIDANLKCDYLPYDQRHFKQKNCRDILESFRNHYQKNEDFNFNEYGNNSTMWQPPRTGGPYGWAGFDPYERCCDRKITSEETIQECLQQLTGHNEHYSTADTVAFHAIAFALLMGYKTVYIAGMDLDYSKGYDNPEMPINIDHLNIWHNYKENTLNDIRILNESAKMLNSRIVNLTMEPWYGEFESGALEL